MGHVVSTKSCEHDVDLFDVEDGCHSNQIKCEGRNATKEESTGEECPICTEDILLRDLAKLDPCNHEFHQECINQWLEDHSTCPNCRQEVSQVVFNYKRCNVAHLRHAVSEDEESLMEDEHDDTLISQSDSESVIDLNQTFDDFESLVVSERIIIGEEVRNSEWDDLQELTELNGSIPNPVNIRVADDTFIYFTFYSKAPEITMQCTDPTATWEILLEDEILATVPANGQLTIRGSFFLHMEDLILRFNGSDFPLREDPEFQEFLHPNPMLSNYFESEELEKARHERIQMFMQYLRDLFSVS